MNINTCMNMNYINMRIRRPAEAEKAERTERGAVDFASLLVAFSACLSRPVRNECTIDGILVF